MTEQPVTYATDTALRLWLRLLGCTRLIENVIRGNLREAFDTTLPRFDVMAQLYRFPDGLRMGEISQLLMVTGGNVTGIIDQLEKEGLAERAPAPNDRRAYVVTLTENGKRAFENMAETHRQWVSDLTGGLSEADQRMLQELLMKLRDSIEEQLDFSTTMNARGRR